MEGDDQPLDDLHAKMLSTVASIWKVVELHSESLEAIKYQLREMQGRVVSLSETIEKHGYLPREGR